MYLKIILYGIFLLIVMRLLSWLVKIIPVKKQHSKRIIYVLPVIEFFIWIGFIIWIVNRLLKDSFIYQPLVIGLLAIGIVAFAWYFLRDFISGLLLKTQVDFKKHDLIKTADTEGKILNIGYLTMKIETSNGDIELIPYNILKSGKVTKPLSEDNYVKQILEIKCRKKLPLTETIEKIRVSALNSPWNVCVKPPVIKLIGETEHHYEFELSVFVMQPEHAQRIKEVI